MTKQSTAIPPPKILLAEDDDALRELLDFALRRAGYNVTSCDNGLALLEHLEYLEHLERYPRQDVETFDLVLTDLRMPMLTGLEVLEAQHNLQRRIPFICMTAFGDAETHQTAKRLGATAIIDKPFTIDILIALIKSHCPLTPRNRN